MITADLKIRQDQITAHNREDGDRTYTVKLDDGEEFLFPSVTTIINFSVNKPALVPWSYGIGIDAALDYCEANEVSSATSGEVKLWAESEKKDHTSVMKEGARRGTDVHKVLEAIINHEPYDFSQKDKPYVDTLKDFIVQYQPEWHWSEMSVASLEDGYAGTFDAICTIGAHPSRRRHVDLTGKRVLLDIKTNKDGRVYPETHLPQVEAYAKAYREMGGDGIDYNLVVGIGPKSFQPCVSYFRYESFRCIHAWYKELQYSKKQNPNRRK